jgi:N-acetylglucosaminyldiphosphoundecaprenol N-acetyl-beta-D-mannosaminyltransferase
VRTARPTGLAPARAAAKDEPPDHAEIGLYAFGPLSIRTGPLSALDARLREWCRAPERRGLLVGFLNPHVYNYAEREPIVRSFITACELVCIDGIAVALASRLLFGASPPRVIATALFDRVLKWSTPRVDAILIGGTLPQARLAAAAINARSRAWRIVDAFSGFMHADEYLATLSKYSDIDAVLVGAGTPKSEHILMGARAVCGRALCWHIGGGTLGLYAGTRSRAPAWVSAIGAEWLHRFIHEPHVRPRVVQGSFEFAAHLLRHRCHSGLQDAP